MSVDRQTEALLALVAADREQRREGILAEARTRTGALLADAHAAARRQMRAAFVEERARRDERVAAARANLQTRRRLALQRRAAALLAEGWRMLPDVLTARWRAPETRRPWVAAVVASAGEVLPRTGWRIVHAPEWPEAERDALAGELTAILGAPPEFIVDPGAGAGLRISASGNVIDSTLPGLTADRADVGAQLLRLLESAEPAEGNT
jgi:hypothetical protein